MDPPQPCWHNFHDFAYFASLAQLASIVELFQIGCWKSWDVSEGSGDCYFVIGDSTWTGDFARF